MAAKILDLELERLPTQIDTLAGYDQALVLFRFQGQSVGQSRIATPSSRLTQRDLYQALTSLDLTPLKQALLRCYFQEREPAPDNPSPQPAWPTMTVAVCTRNRASDLLTCLQSLCKIDYAPLDILVVDNAPADDATKQLVAQFPQVRYICAPRPGLDWARNRAILESSGDILAFTDDDVIVDQGWVSALASIFAADPTVMAVTGLVVPFELETEAQALFEGYGGFGRGFQRRWHGIAIESRRHGPGKFGTGANMAFRRTLFAQIGGFDPALDVGTVTHGGGDLEFFFRLLQEGHTLVYEPNALVRHRHRRTYAQLRTQLVNNGIGLCAYFVRSAFAYPDQRRIFLWLLIYWLLYWCCGRLILSFVRPMPTPRVFILYEIWGSLLGLGRYPQAQRDARKLEASFGPVDNRNPMPTLTTQNCAVRPQLHAGDQAIPVYQLDLSQQLPTFDDAHDYAQVRIYVTLYGRLFGSFDLYNQHKPISRARLLDLLCEVVAKQLPITTADLAPTNLQGWAGRQLAELNQLANLKMTEQQGSQYQSVPNVSIVVATLDRPDRLLTCLQRLTTLHSMYPVEIIIVDNHPASGLTPPVVAQFPGVRLVSEARQGLAYARNAGFLASSGELVVATDDDVITSTDWLEKLLAPFADRKVMVVTGNVLPLELETTAQQLFEVYGGLGRGFETVRVDLAWFRSFRWMGVPTWTLGATANAAFRASIFDHPQIGLMDEALGPGMPSGVGEDTYLFYKVLKAGFEIVYQPNAFVWHQHRRELAALRRQLFDYSKGHVAYHLTTLLGDGDWRGLWHLCLYFPLVRVWQLVKGLLKELLGENSYPLSLLFLELRGNLAGPWALWQSRQRVEREGRSRPSTSAEPMSSTSREKSNAYQVSASRTQ